MRDVLRSLSGDSLDDLCHSLAVEFKYARSCRKIAAEEATTAFGYFWILKS
jgi:hypothetical protein